MFLPSIQGVIRRRILVNFRVDPDVIRPLLPDGLAPKLQNGYAIAGICLIRLERIRPARLPAQIGFSSENAAHRVAVVWRDREGIDREGVYIPMRHTSSLPVLVLGGRLFPGLHKRAEFQVTDEHGSIDISVRSTSGDMRVNLRAGAARQLPSTSVFQSLADASAFFRSGSLGYSPGRHDDRLEGLQLISSTWQVEPLAVSDVHSSWLSDRAQFPSGSSQFDCALVMRNTTHRWVAAPDLHIKRMELDAAVLPHRI